MATTSLDPRDYSQLRVIRSALFWSSSPLELYTQMKDIFAKRECFEKVPDEFPPFWKSLTDSIKEFTIMQFERQMQEGQQEKYEIVKDTFIDVFLGPTKNLRKINRDLLYFMLEKQVITSDEFTTLYEGYLEVTWTTRDSARLTDLNEQKERYKDALDLMRRGGHDRLHFSSCVLAREPSLETIKTEMAANPVKFLTEQLMVVAILDDE